MKTRTRPAARRGFSLIEMLTVIAIITLLMSIGVATYGNVRNKAINAKASAEVAQLGTCLMSFKTHFNNVSYIPAGFTLRSNYPANDPDGAYLKILFPRLDLSNTGLPASQTLNQNQSLVFFLSGGSVTNYTGFSINKQQPFTTGGDRTGPFFEFPANRINTNGEFTDPYGTPYAYFTSINGNDYPAVSINGATPYKQGGRFINQKSFQLISAGRDKLFGPGGEWTPGEGAWASPNAGADDLANFGNGMLGNP